MKGKKILVGITGGIAAYKICSLVRLFVKNGAEVRVIMTKAAANFVSPAALSTLSKNEVVINIFPEESNFTESEKVETKTLHVNLGMWADLFVIAPATANTIAKIVNGICDNFLLTTVLSSKCPVIVAPAMDDDMYKHPATKSNLVKLKDLGYKILEPSFGELASGIFGEGRMKEPEEIFAFVKSFLSSKNDLKGKSILVTAGPTIEYLDSVRYLSNPSTGKMGFEIARAASERGADVTLISGPVNLSSDSKIKRIDVKTSEEMFKKVKANLSSKNLVIMTAAVEDFKPVMRAKSKIKKESKDKFVFEFEKTVDILDYLGRNKSGFKLIGFALETDNEIENARKKLKSKNLDLIVLNNPKTSGAGFGTDTNIVTFIDRKGLQELPKMSKFEVGNKILDKYLKLK